MASRLEQISDAIADAPEIDAGKVKAAKDALSRGTYEVDPRRIADKLLHLDRAFRRRR